MSCDGQRPFSCLKGIYVGIFTGILFGSRFLWLFFSSYLFQLYKSLIAWQRAFPVPQPVSKLRFPFSDHVQRVQPGKEVEVAQAVCR